MQDKPQIQQNKQKIQKIQKEEEKPQNQTQEGKKDPQTMSQGQRMGLSKQQLRKLQKRLNAKKKLKQKQEKQQLQLKKKQQKKAKNQTKAKNIQQIDPVHRKAFSQQKIHLPKNKQLPQKGQDAILITSALPYVNNVPHLGNIIGCVLSADVFSRYKKLQGINTLYICGTDQYGTATQVKALEESKAAGVKITPKQVCNKYYLKHKQIYEWFDIEFDHFGRTSQDWHEDITRQIFNHINKQGKISQKQMTQCYCQACDLFLADRFIYGTCPYCGYEDARGDQCDKCQKLINDPKQLINFRCNICKSSPIIKQTKHFFIQLTQIQPQLQKWVHHTSKQGQWSQNSIAITNAWLKTGLKSKCITRDLKWGVKVPQCQNKVFYVWFDAPIGYLSITAQFIGQNYTKWWKNPDVKLYQFMGKDNVPFHTVVFPSSLIASKQGWTLLHHISTTQYLNYEFGQKFSKSRGIGVFGDQARLLDVPSQVWRYYLLINRPEKNDSQYSWKDFINKNNNELLANLGNLVQRVLKYIYNNFDKKIPQRENLQQGDQIFVNEIKQLYNQYKKKLDKVQIKQGLKLCMQISSRANRYLQQSKFWQQEKVNSGRFQSFIIEPYLPSTSAKINYLLGLQLSTNSSFDRQLGKHLNDNFDQLFLSLVFKSTGVKQPIPLFVEYTVKNEQQWRQRFKGKQT